MPAVLQSSATSTGAWRRLGRAALIVVLLELGLLLLVVPWTGVWQHNYFAQHFSALGAWLLSPYCKGAISGLGLINLWFGTGEISHFRLRR